MGYAFNPNDPRYQRDVQRVAAKKSMGTSAFRGTLRSRLGDVSARHAGYQQGRQLEFGRLAAQRRASLLRHNQGMAGLAHQGRLTGLSESALKSKKKMLPFQIGLGVAGTIYGTMEGRRRAGLLRAQTAKEDARWDNMEKRLGEGAGSGNIVTGPSSAWQNNDASMYGYRREY